MKRISILALLIVLFGCNQTQGIKIIGPDEFEEAIAQPGVQIVDVRTHDEFASGHIPGAINIDFTAADFSEKASRRLSPDRPVAVYCRVGRRSAGAVAKLVGYHGFELKGGIAAWTAAGKPLHTGR